MHILDDGGTLRSGQVNVGEVPYGLYAAAREALRDLDGDLLRHRQDRDVDGIFLEIGLKLLHAVDGNAVHRRADEPRVDIERGAQMAAPAAEAEVVDKGAANVADADKHRGKASVKAEYRRDLRAQSGNVVAVALLPEFTEAAEILTYLRRGKAKLLPKLGGGDPADAFFRKFVQLAQITGQAADNVVGYFCSLHCNSLLTLVYIFHTNTYLWELYHKF